MAVFGSIGSFLKSRQMLALLAVVAGVAALGYGVSTLAGASEMPPSEASRQPSTGLEKNLAQSSEIAVKGRLVFPRQQHLTFETPGEVGEVLVQEGDRVTAGQVLARLDRTSLIEMEEAIAQVKLDRLRLDEALDRARKEFAISPLEGARFNDEIARARKGLKDVLEQLDDFQRNHQLKIANATRAKAESEFALYGVMQAGGSGQAAPQSGAEGQGSMQKSSMESLSDFQSDYQRQLTEAQRLYTEAQVAVDRAEDHLAGFELDHRGEVGAARLGVSLAEEGVIEAQNAVTAFLVPIGLTTSLGDIRIEDGADPNEILDSPLDYLARLRTDVEEAKVNLEQAKEDLLELEENRPLRLEERQRVVAEVQAALTQAQDNLADLEKEPDNFLLQSLEASVEADRAALADAEIDLARLLDGPDPEDLAVLQEGVAGWRATLQDLFKVDSLEVAVLEARDATAEARLEDIIEDLKGATLRAPIAGIVSLVNVEVDDRVTDESRVMILVDPTVVEVAGIVDASQVRLVQPGAEARITIASVPGQQLRGNITSVAGEPRTERGVVNYVVAVQVNLPPGVKVPLGPTAVSVLVNAITVN